MSEPDPELPRRGPQREEKKPKLGLPFILILVVIFLLIAKLTMDGRYTDKPYSDVRQAIIEDKVAKVVISGKTSVQVELRPVNGADPERWSANLAEDQGKALTTLVDEKNQEIDERNRAARENPGATAAAPLPHIELSSPPESQQLLSTFLGYTLLPILIIGALFWFLMRRMGPPQGVMNFGKSKAKIYAEKEVHVTFSDVAGCDEAVEEVKEIVEFLKEPKKFQALGARIPKGVLLLGAPGTGKTLLARAVAGEAAVPFFSLSGSDFVEMFVGVGASRVRDLFRQAESQSPCLVFIDELDALGKTRGSSPISNDEREQTLNALLVEMDGFDPNSGVIIIAATNRPEILDPALMRPGRFDRQIVVDRPDVAGRQKILEVHARKVKLGSDVELAVVAKRTPGFVGADLANIVNEAALLAARRDKKAVSMDELEEAIDRVMTGLERRRRGMTMREKEIVATHETGHALAGYFSPGNDPVHRISIIPRGVGTGGHTLYLPEEERMLYTRDEIVARIVASLGGRAAERVVYEHLSTGAASDLEHATRLARHMTTRYGMSEVIGPVSLEEEGSNYLRDPMFRPQRNYSEDTQHEIDAEVRDLITRCEKRAIEIITKHKPALERIRAVLMEKEVLEREEFEKLMAESEAAPAAPPAEPAASRPSAA
jgi:cell division protease FtsH